MQYGDARAVYRHLETAEEKKRILLFVQYRDRVSSMLALLAFRRRCRILLMLACVGCYCVDVLSCHFLKSSKMTTVTQDPKSFPIFTNRAAPTITSCLWIDAGNTKNRRMCATTMITLILGVLVLFGDPPAGVLVSCGVLCEGGECASYICI